MLGDADAITLMDEVFGAGTFKKIVSPSATNFALRGDFRNPRGQALIYDRPAYEEHDSVLVPRDRSGTTWCRKIIIDAGSALPHRRDLMDVYLHLVADPDGADPDNMLFRGKLQHAEESLSNAAMATINQSQRDTREDILPGSPDFWEESIQKSAMDRVAVEARRQVYAAIWQEEKVHLERALRVKINEEDVSTRNQGFDLQLAAAPEWQRMRIGSVKCWGAWREATIRVGDQRARVLFLDREFEGAPGRYISMEQDSLRQQVIQGDTFQLARAAGGFISEGPGLSSPESGMLGDLVFSRSRRDAELAMAVQEGLYRRQYRKTACHRRALEMDEILAIGQRALTNCAVSEMKVHAARSQAAIHSIARAARTFTRWGEADSFHPIGLASRRLTLTDDNEREDALDAEVDGVGADSRMAP